MADLNDPRILFAAERTLLAWSRTSLTLMGFGFLIERFGLFLHMQFSSEVQFIQRGASFWVGIIFIALGTVVAVFASVQYRRLVRTLKQGDIPEGYWVNLGVLVNSALGALGMGLVGYLFYGF